MSYNLRNPQERFDTGRPSKELGPTQEQTEKAPVPPVAPAKAPSETDLRAQRREQRAADRDKRNAPPASSSSASAAMLRGGQRQ